MPKINPFKTTPPFQTDNHPKLFLVRPCILQKWKLSKISPFKTTLHPFKVTIIQNCLLHDNSTLQKCTFSKFTLFKTNQDHHTLKTGHSQISILLRLSHHPLVNKKLQNLFPCHCYIGPRNQNAPQMPHICKTCRLVHVKIWDKYVYI